MGRLPFTVDRSSGKMLTEQVVNGLRDAIESGQCPAGLVLPTLKELAEELNVSMIVIRRAIRRLANEGFVCPRPKVGIEVLARRKKVWKGRVLLVLPEGYDNLFVGIAAGALRDRISNDGWLLSSASVPRKRDGGWDMRYLEEYLARGVDLAVLFFHRQVLELRLSRSSTPFIVVSQSGNALLPGCRGRIRLFYDDVSDAFIRDCRASKVKSALQIRVYSTAIDVTRTLSAAGIAARNVDLSSDADTYGRVEGTLRAGLDFGARLVHGEYGEMPDLLVVTDDFLATGVLQSLSYYGIKVPEKLRVVTWANKKIGPVYPVELTRFEMDPASAGMYIARCVLGCLSGRRIPARAHISPLYCRGGSL